MDESMAFSILNPVKKVLEQNIEYSVILEKSSSPCLKAGKGNSWKEGTWIVLAFPLEIKEE